MLRLMSRENLCAHVGGGTLDPLEDRDSLGRGPGGQRAQAHRFSAPSVVASALGVCLPSGPDGSGVWRCWRLGWACVARAALACLQGQRSGEASGLAARAAGPRGRLCVPWSAAPRRAGSRLGPAGASSVCSWQALGSVFPTSPGASGWQCFKGNERATTRFPSLCLGQVCKCSGGQSESAPEAVEACPRSKVGGRRPWLFLTLSLGRDFVPRAGTPGLEFVSASGVALDKMHLVDFPAGSQSLRFYITLGQFCISRW